MRAAAKSPGIAVAVHRPNLPREEDLGVYGRAQTGRGGVVNTVDVENTKAVVQAVGFVHEEVLFRQLWPDCRRASLGARCSWPSFCPR